MNKLDTEDYPVEWIGSEIKNKGEYVNVLIELIEDQNTNSKYKWYNDKESKNLDFIRKDNYCKVEIIKESIKPIKFLVQT